LASDYHKKAFRPRQTTFVLLFRTTTHNLQQLCSAGMTSTKLLFVMALSLAVFTIVAMADNKYDDKYDNNKGPCKGSYWPDGKGCCPKIIHGKAYYRDGNKCYPKDVGCGVYYADGNGYTPAHIPHQNKHRN
jgi:hypothetical protein